MKDRGMIKWQPFNNLGNFNQLVEVMAQNKTKIYSFVLAQDQIELINKNLIIAFTNNKKVKIIYLTNGYFSTIIDLIKKIDPHKKIISIDNYQIKYKQIYDLIIVN